VLDKSCGKEYIKGRRGANMSLAMGIWINGIVLGMAIGAILMLLYNRKKNNG